MFLLKAILFVVLVLVLSLLFIWIRHKAKKRLQARLARTINMSGSGTLPRHQLLPEQHYLEGIGYLVGDITCKFNARSAYIRCAVNPSGPCDGCIHYQTRDSKPNLKN